MSPSFCFQQVAGSDTVADKNLTFSSDTSDTEPCNSLDYLDGEAPAGDWHLYVYDENANNEAGEIADGYSISFGQGAPTITAGPQDRSVAAGTNATFSVDAVADATTAIQWQVFDADYGFWQDIDGANAADYTVSAPTLDASGNQYRATLNNDYDYAESSPATLTVTGTAPAAPQSFTATQTGPGEVTVTWAPPVSSGDSAVTGYDVGYGAGEYGDGLTVGPEIRNHVFSGLSNGAYTFSVAAVNLAGNGDRVRQPLTVGAYTPPTPAPPAPARKTPTFSASDHSVVSGDSVRFSGIGQPGERVTLDRSVVGHAYRAVTTFTVDSTGHYTGTAHAVNTAVYRVHGATGLVSGATTVVAKSAMTLGADRVARRKYELHGRVLPARAGQLVKLSAKRVGGSFFSLGQVKADKSGRWSSTEKLGAKRKFVFRAVAAATDRNATNTKTLTVSVR